MSCVKGEILKRSTRTDCKSVGTAFVGSNPALPTLGLSLSLSMEFGEFGEFGEFEYGV